MIMTYDWIIMATRNKKWKEEIEKALASDRDQELIYLDMLRIKFDAQIKRVTVQAFSEDSPFHWKVIPKQMTYHFVQETINGNWDAINENDIIDIWPVK